MVASKNNILEEKTFKMNFGFLTDNQCFTDLSCISLFDDYRISKIDILFQEGFQVAILIYLMKQEQQQKNKKKRKKSKTLDDRRDEWIRVL